jgi:hypothetical protein
MTTAELLATLDACVKPIAWAAAYPDPSDAWDHCHRGDWLLWAAVELGVAHKLVTLAACDCARTALRHVPPGEDRPRLAIEAAEAWCRGEATEKEATYTAGAYTTFAPACRAAEAAEATSYASCAAEAASYAPWTATYAAYAADAASYAAEAASYDPWAAAARAAANHCAAHQRCADLVRDRIPWPVMHECIRAHRPGGCSQIHPEYV